MSWFRIFRKNQDGSIAIDTHKALSSRQAHSKRSELIKSLKGVVAVSPIYKDGHKELPSLFEFSQQYKGGIPIVEKKRGESACQ